MKKETKVKLDNLVGILCQEMGLKRHDLELSNFMSLILSICQKRGIVLHRLTVEKYENFILDRVEDWWWSYDKEQEKTVEEEIIVVDEVVSILVNYKSGKVVKFTPETILEVEKVDSIVEAEKVAENENKVVKKPNYVWRGLFKYLDTGTFIRTGKYTGCNIEDNTALKNHFGSAIEFYGWILDCLKPSSINKIKGTREEWELEMNIKTLEELKTKIEKSKIYSQFPNMFIRKRKSKGL